MKTSPFCAIVLFLEFTLGNSIFAANCTQVIGFSQVGWDNGGWYMTGGAFESQAGNAAWQLLWENGAGIDQWQNANYSGWNKSITSPCASGSNAPERVLLSVSGSYSDNVNAWMNALIRYSSFGYAGGYAP